MKRLDQLVAERNLVWLDSADYAGRLLAEGAVPWLDLSAYLAWQRQAQSLLRSDVLMLPLESVCHAWVQAHAALRSEMASKSRTLFPLKRLFANSELRTYLGELVDGLRGSFVDVPLALACPSPRHWVALAHAWAHGTEPEVGEDDIDAAAVLLADFMRQFGEAGVDVLLLQEAPGRGAVSTAEIELYQPVCNIATHYRWEMGLLAPDGVDAAGASAFGFVLAPQPPSGAFATCWIADAYWLGDNAPVGEPHELRYSRIAPEAAPEVVLDRLRQLRPA